MPQPHRPLERRHDEQVHETRSYRLELKVAPDGTIEGYGSVFNAVDSYADSVAPGAFADSLAAHKAAGTMPAMLWQHEPDKPIGVWDEIAEDANGLRVKGRLALDTSKGKEAHVLCKMNALNGLSIGFVSKEWKYDRDPSGEEIRTLTAIDLWEVSLVTFPANTLARVTGVKSGGQPPQTIRQVEQCLRDEGISAAKAKELISDVKRIVEAEREAKARDAEELAARALLQSIIPSPKES